jgi:large subunit ribosomal protein L1
MSKEGKRMREARKEIDREKTYELKEALTILKKGAKAKFDESVDLSIRLGVDPRKAEQMVRGTCELPNGTGKKVRVLAIAKGPKAEEAQKAGADIVGAEDVIAKIQEGWFDFDRIVCTPDMMGQVGKIGKVLGPRGLMPNPKAGTVTMEIGAAIKSIKAGQVAFRVDKAGIVHVPVGRASFDEGKLEQNLVALLETIKRMKPSTAKGVYLKSATISTTMGPGVHLDTQAL